MKRIVTLLASVTVFVAVTVAPVTAQASHALPDKAGVPAVLSSGKVPGALGHHATAGSGSSVTIESHHTHCPQMPPQAKPRPATPRRPQGTGNAEPCGPPNTR